MASAACTGSALADSVTTDTSGDNGTILESGHVRNIRTNLTYDRIQWGIDNATAGDTLEVSYATFNEKIVVNKALTIRGAGDGRPTIDGKGAERVVDIAANNVTLDGFIVTGSASPGFGIYGYGAGIAVRDCQVTGNGFGIFFAGADGTTVESCNVAQNACGITFDGTSDGRIAGCSISASTQYGISLEASSNDNRVVSNIVANNGGAGIQIVTSDRNVLTYNDVRDNGGYGMTVQGQHNLAYLNTFRNNRPVNAISEPGSGPDNNLWHSDGPVNYRYNGVQYTGVVGNYWDSFNGVDDNYDGIAGTQFTSGRIVDTSPLVMIGSEIKDVRNAGTSTEATSASLIWLILLALIPLSGIVIYYFAFVRDK